MRRERNTLWQEVINRDSEIDSEIGIEVGTGTMLTCSSFFYCVEVIWRDHVCIRRINVDHVCVSIKY